MTRDEIKAIRPLIEQLPDFYQNSPCLLYKSDAADDV